GSKPARRGSVQAGFGQIRADYNGHGFNCNAATALFRPAAEPGCGGRPGPLRVLRQEPGKCRKNQAKSPPEPPARPPPPLAVTKPRPPVPARQNVPRLRLVTIRQIESPARWKP